MSPSFLADQPWWGARLYERGLAPRPISPRRLDRRRIAAALGEIEPPNEAVRRVAQSMAAEDGEAAALRVIRKGLSLD